MKTFSLTSFLIGLLTGSIVTILIGGAFVAMSIRDLSAGQGFSESLLNDIVNQAISDRDFAQSKSVYGQVQSISDTEIIIEASRTGETQTLTFTYDNTTRFHTYLNDDASTKIDVTPSTVVSGDYVTITSDSVISAETKQSALSVIEI